MFQRFVPPPILQPDLWLGSLRIAEPVTTLTALMISAICFYAWLQLRRHPVQNRVLQLIRLFFIGMALATLSGGILGHAFLYAGRFEWKIPGWVISMVSIAAIERAAIMHARPLMHPFWGRFFSVFNLLELAGFLFLSLYTLNFHFVEIHVGYGLLVVVGLFEGYVWRLKRDPGSARILWAIPVAALAVGLHLMHFSPSVWFTYFDIGHLLMCVCAWLVYRGAENMRHYQRIQ